MAEQLLPLFNNVLLKRVADEQTTTETGLILVEEKKQQSWRAEVLSVGNGQATLETDIDSNFITRKVTEVKAGDIVYVPAFAGYETVVGMDRFLLVKDTEILCVVRRAN